MFSKHKHSRTRVACVAAAVALTLSVAACSSSGNKSTNSTGASTGGGGASSSSGSSGSSTSPLNVKIGMPIALTGANAFAGIELADAAKLAAKTVNASGGRVHIDINEADTKGVTDAAISAFNQVSSSADLVAGIAFTQEAEALKPFVAKYKKPVLFFQATDLSGRSDNAYSMAPSQEPLMEDMVNSMPAKGIKSIALIWSQAPFGEQDAAGARAAAKKDNIKITSDTGVALDATDFSAAITKATQSNPDAIVLMALPNQSGLMVTKIRSLGYKGALYGQQGDGNAVFAQTAGSAAANYQFYTFWDPAVASDPTSQAFISAYKAAYPKEPAPDVFAAIGWDAINIIAQAVQNAGSTDSAAILNQFKTATFKNMVLEPTLSFGSDGFVKASGYLVTYAADGTKSKVAAF